MKKALALVIVLLLAAGGLTCYLVVSRLGIGGFGESKNARLAAQAMEEGDYERARRLYGFVEAEGKASARDREILEILDAYLSADEALKTENYKDGIDLIDSIRFSYKGLTIAEDMEGLRIALSHGLSVEDKLEALGRAINAGNETVAGRIADELSRMDLTENQREKYFSYRRSMIKSDGNDDGGSLIYYVDAEKGGAALFADASELADTVLRIPDGEAVEVLELTENGFVRVAYKNDTGYLPFRSLSPSRIYRDTDKEDDKKDEEDDETENKKDENKDDDKDSDEGGLIAEDVEDKPATQTAFTVKVEPSKLSGGTLPIYSGPGKTYSESGSVTSTMILTIVEESDGWGKLKSGAGWIELARCTKTD